MMMKRIAIPLVLIFVLTAMLAGCGGNKTDEKDTPAAQDSSALAATDMDFKLADAADITVTNYNLGEGDLRNMADKKAPAPLDGIIAVPKGDGPHPVIVLLHGTHKNADPYKDKNYEGFDFLVKQLAAQGYVAVAINRNVTFNEELYGKPKEPTNWNQQLYQYHIDHLTQANEGKDNGFGVDLKGKLDMKNVHLLGHSSGGESVGDIAKADAASGSNTIKSVLYIASVEDQETPPNIPIGILVGEQDEQYLSAAAFTYFDHAKLDAKRTAPAQVTYLRGATHAYFNRKMELKFETEEEKADYEKNSPLTREQQEEFFTHYVCQFLDIYALNNEKSATGTYDPKTPEPSKMYNRPVTASFWAPGSEALVNAVDKKTELVATGKATANHVVQEINDKELLFKHAGGTRDVPMYKITWADKADAITITPPQTDFSGFASLDIYTAMIPGDELNEKGVDQSFTVTLTDTAGKTKSILVPKGTPATAQYIGKKAHYDSGIEGDKGWDYWAGDTPLSDLRLPLSMFEGVDLKSIKEVSLQFDQTTSGAIMISEIWLGK